MAERREDELRTAHTVFQSTFDKEKRREAERKAELERQRRVEVDAPCNTLSPVNCFPACASNWTVTLEHCCDLPGRPVYHGFAS